MKDRAFLWLLSGASLVCLGWTLWLYNPAWLLPAAVLFGGVLAYDALLQRRSLRRGQAREVDVSAGVKSKVEILQRAFPGQDRHLRFFFEAVLNNASLKDSELASLLRFHHKLPVGNARSCRRCSVWSGVVRTRGAGSCSRATTARARLRGNSWPPASTRFAGASKKCRLTRKQVRQIEGARRALRMDIRDVLEIVTVRPRILRGLWKSPRPAFAWPVPTAAALLATIALARLVPGLSAPSLFSILMGIVVLGLYVVSMRLAIAPGILRYGKTRRHLSAALARNRTPAPC